MFWREFFQKNRYDNRVIHPSSDANEFFILWDSNNKVLAVIRSKGDSNFLESHLSYSQQKLLSNDIIIDSEKKRISKSTGCCNNN